MELTLYTSTNSNIKIALHSPQQVEYSDGSLHTVYKSTILSDKSLYHDTGSVAYTLYLQLKKPEVFLKVVPHKTKEGHLLHDFIVVKKEQRLDYDIKYYEDAYNSKYDIWSQCIKIEMASS